MRKATSGIDYTSRDYLAFKQSLIDKLQEKIPEYTDTSETDAGIIIIEALANGLDICSLYTDALANDVLLSTTQDRRLACILAGNLGYVPYNQTASKVPMVFVLEEEQEEDVVISRGTIVTTEETEDSEPIQFETLEDLIIPPGNLGDEVDDEGNYLYSVLAGQGETVEEDYIGSSNGTPYQTFQLSYDKVLVDSISLYVDEGDGPKLWRRVPSFLDCSATDRVYVTMVDEYDVCSIQFGNNLRGKIPNPIDNGIMASYRTGGGIIGNVKEYTVTEIESDVPFIEECFNLEPVVLGHNKEPLEEIKYNGPANWRTRDRAVTLQDYSDLIRINVAKIDEFYAFLNTVTLNDPKNALGVLIYYQLREGYTFDKKLSDIINDFFPKRTIIGTTYELVPYTPYIIDLEATLIVHNDYDIKETTQEVLEFVDNYFSYGNFTFNDELVKSELENEVVSIIPGVRSYRINAPEDDIIKAPSSDQIITLGSHTII